MVAEIRAQWSEFDSRRHFTEPKKPIRDTRTVLAETVQEADTYVTEQRTAVSATALNRAARDGFVEVG